MAKEYRRTPMVRLIGVVMSWLARRGKGPAAVLTTTGRKTQVPHRVPVSPIELDGVEYLVAPYGPVGWVKNLRAHPEGTLRHGKVDRPIAASEVGGDEAAPVVAAYHRRENLARRYMELPDDPAIEDFAAHIAQFPVFRIERV